MNATNARLGKRTQTMVPTAVLRAMIVVSTLKQPWKDHLNATPVTTVRRPRKAVPNAKRAVLEDTAPGVKTARKVNTVMVLIQLPRHVAIAPPVITTTTRAKDRVCHAVPVNSTMLQVLLVANYVSTQPTLVAKEETAVASIVQQVGLPKTAVQNVLRAVRVRLALGVKSVHWGFPEKGTIQMRLNANNVNWVKQQRLKVPLNAMIVMPEDLATPKEIVRHARLVFIKTSKVKQSAVITVTC
jgi:hypothetical protein